MPAVNTVNNPEQTKEFLKAEKRDFMRQSYIRQRSQRDLHSWCRTMATNFEGEMKAQNTTEKHYEVRELKSEPSFVVAFVAIMR